MTTPVFGDSAGDSAHEMFRGNVPVDYHQFFIADEGDLPTAPERSNGLADPTEYAIDVLTGAAAGVVAVAVEFHPTPPALQIDPWDEVVEVSVETPSGELRLMALMDDIDPYPPALTSAPGWYRVRVHARGRDTNIDGVAFEPTEDYLIQLWPGHEAPELVHKRTDEYGALVRAASQGRPVRSDDSPPAAPAIPAPAVAPTRERAQGASYRRQSGPGEGA